MTSVSKVTIGELVANDWRTAEVFKKYSIDFCCGGKRTVEEACIKRGIDPATVEADLKAVQKGSGSTHNFKTWELDFLADFIINNHHKYVKEAAPFLDELCHKVARVHGDAHAELIEIKNYTMQVLEEFSFHMNKEEMILFPYIKSLVEAEKAGKTIEPPPFGTIANPISTMETEHTSSGDAMEEIKDLSNQFTPPVDACMSYRVLFAKLQEFQQDLHQHIHLENNILFPKALQLEKKVLPQ
ncbi:MAG: iron-sulfur cluster repair di-iron protein [Crocinitomicaceae bacterium]|nr:iron-sulfur cluster repair di-iron protein [Crocinitomicaceae bacterium]